MSDQNPTAKPIPDEPWIRDLNARDLLVEVNSHESAAQACEGLKTYCSYCGQGFPAWPPKEMMGHIQVEHAKDLTLQQLNSCAALCDPDWTLHHVQYFTVFVLTYVPLRRRLRDLGLIIFTEPELSRSSGVLGPDGRRVQ